MPRYNLMNCNGDDPWPGNVLIVSTQRLSEIAELGCLDVAEAARMPRCFVCSEAKMHSQMGADWTPDDLLWCGGVVCFEDKRRGREGKEKGGRGTGHQMPC